MASPGGPPGLDAILHELRLAVRALNELAAALRDAVLHPPVQLQVERLEVETLEFHLGDIDVEQLQGELNIGITHSLRVNGPGPEDPRRSPGQEHKMKPGGPRPPTVPEEGVTEEPVERIPLWPPPETEGKEKP